MEAGEKYLAGDIDLGLIGKQRVLVLPNENKEKSKQPDHYVYVKKDDGLDRVGAMWINTKREAEEVETEEHNVF